MTKQEYEMTRVHFTNFIINNLPVDDSELESCWGEFIEELKENDFYGNYGFFDATRGCMVDVLNKDFITSNNKNGAFDNAVSMLEHYVPMKQLREINDCVKKCDFQNKGVFYLDTDLCLKHNDVSVNFHYPEDRFLFLSVQGDAVNLFNFSISDSSFGFNETEDILECCVHYVIQKLCDSDGDFNVKSLCFHIDAIHVVDCVYDENKVEHNMLDFDLSDNDCIILKKVMEEIKTRISAFSEVLL